MSIRIISIAAAVTFLFAAGGIGYYAWELHRQLTASEAERANAQNQATNVQNQADTLKARLTQTEKQLDEARHGADALEREKQRLQREKDAVTQAQKSLEQDMRSTLQTKNVTISELQGKLTVNILDRVLFDSGRAELTEEGKQVLQKIAEVLKRVPDRQILVVGHTDNVPIQSMKYLYNSNWELSSARANAAVRYISEDAGVDPKRLGAVGFGEHRPIADNATPEGRAQNRRIAIVVMAQDFLGNEKPVSARPAAPAEK